MEVQSPAMGTATRRGLLGALSRPLRIEALALGLQDMTGFGGGAFREMM